jgi:hypothetical protein
VLHISLCQLQNALSTSLCCLELEHDLPSGTAKRIMSWNSTYTLMGLYLLMLMNVKWLYYTIKPWILIWKFCWIWGYHSWNFEEFCLLECRAILSSESQQTLRRNTSHPFLRPNNKPMKNPVCFILVPGLAYFSNLKMKVIRSSEMFVIFNRTTRGYTPEDRTLHRHRCENLQFNCNSYNMIILLTL